MCNSNIVELLYALDVGNSADNGKVAADTLRVLFRALPFHELVEGFSYVDANRLVPYMKLTAETSCYWRHLVAFLHGEGAGAAELAEQKLLPELSDFCRYLRHYVLEVERPQHKEQEQGQSVTMAEGSAAEDMGWTFVARQLIEMTSLFDLADEVGRANLAQLCKDFMSSGKVPVSFVEPLMSVFSTVRTDTETRVRDVAEVIAELRDPMRSPGEENGGERNESMTRATGQTANGSPDIVTSTERIKAVEEESRKKQVPAVLALMSSSRTSL